MKPEFKSAVLRCVGAMVVFLALAACDSNNTEMPHVFGGDEVPPDVRAEPRPVAVPATDASNQPWQRLGDVPAKPRDFTAQPLIDRTKQEMETDRVQAERLQQQYENPAPAPYYP